MSRFFFALWPDNVIREAILTRRSQLVISGRMINKSNLHATLVFLGKLNVNQQQQIITLAEEIPCSNFEICLNHAGYFNNSKVVWLGLDTIPDALLQLHKQLFSAAEQCHIPVKRQTYKPHVTLARKVSPVTAKPISPIKWLVKDFVLVESIDSTRGVQYHILKHFPCN